MCGIAGWVGSRIDKSNIAEMLDAISHRGPDGTGHKSLPVSDDCEAVFGHVRLSILDIESGAQPMVSHCGRFTITYNGEVYNYIELREELEGLGATFRTNSDTEVILASWVQWGEKCLERFRGMFAFALYDASSRAVHFARDPFGKKPLFFAETGNTLVFGSEIPALLANPLVERSLNVDAIYSYLCWRYMPAPQTFFKGIRKLLPGSLATFKDGKLSEKRYWKPSISPSGNGAMGDEVDSFSNIFDEAVRIRLRSDVPVGMFLSSGIDSAAVLESVARSGSNVKAFSVGYSNETVSELEAASKLADAFGTPFEPIVVDPSGMVDRIHEMTLKRAAPVSEPADVPIYTMSKRASEEVKVVLSGEGSDELFAGYPKHLMEAHLGGLGPLSKALGSVMTSTKNRRMKVAGKALRSADHQRRMIQWFGAITSQERSAIWNGAPVPAHYDKTPFEAPQGASSLQKALHFDQTSWLPDNLLERGDRMTMAASIELRAPFMDIELAKFSEGLPDSWRIKGRTTKRILREAMKDKLPGDVLSRKKKGFPVPISNWFKGDLEQALNDRLCSSTAIIKEHIDGGWIENTVAVHRQGDSSQDKRLWMLFALEEFLQSYFGR